MTPEPAPGFFEDLTGSIVGYFSSMSWVDLRLKLQAIGALFSILLLAAIIIIEIRSRFIFTVYRRKLKNLFTPLHPTKDKFIREMERIDQLAVSHNAEKLREAIISLNKITESVFDASGYPGDFKGAIGYFKTSLHQPEELLSAHDFVLKLKTDKAVSLTKIEAEKIIKVYKQALQDLQVI